MCDHRKKSEKQKKEHFCGGNVLGGMNFHADIRWNYVWRNLQWNAWLMISLSVSVSEIFNTDTTAIGSMLLDNLLFLKSILKLMYRTAVERISSWCKLEV